MSSKRFVVVAALAGGTLLALGATFLNVGVARADETQDVRLRQESARSSGGGVYAGTRSHRGGGLRGGK